MHHQISELQLHLIDTIFVEISEIGNLPFLPDLDLIFTINC